MKRFIFFSLQLISISSFSQSRWQQKVEYKMDVTLDHSTHKYTGKQSLIYYNNSPDALTKVFYHLYFNAFQPGSAMDIRSRTIVDPDPRVGDRISKLKSNEQGYCHVKSLKIDGRTLQYTENETILEVVLDKPLPAGSKAIFDLEFEGQVPLQIRRSGRDNAEGIDYSMSQWYPKMCEYDNNGWHPNPYIGREFYGVWGNFDVNITIDKEYTVAATGVLQNPNEIGKGYEDINAKVKSSSGKQLTWQFKAQNVHDFVWAADTEYVHDKKQVPNGPMIHFFYKKDPSYSESWTNFQDYIIKDFTFMSEQFGQYPYPVYSVIQGGDGGMEYPMATLITGNRKLPSLVGVTVHEAAHSWYQGVLATNESLYAWMDEGFTSYASTEAMHFLFANGLPNDHSAAYNGYYEIVREGKIEALDTHADHFITNYAYGTAAYNIGEMYLAQLGYVLGEENLAKGLLLYFNTWKFKHPNAEDFIHVMELQSGMVLDWYNEYWIHSIKTVDYGIASLEGKSDRVVVTLIRKGDAPMPVDVEVVMSDGSRTLYTIPLDLMRGEKASEGYKGNWIVMPDWNWVNPTYSLLIPKPIGSIQSITIDPLEKMADVDRKNNQIIPSDGINFILENR